MIKDRKKEIDQEVEVKKIEGEKFQFESSSLYLFINNKVMQS